MSNSCYYKILHVSQTATLKEIKTAYRKLALLYHPDAGTGADTARFIAISQALEVLSDPSKRLEYDRKISDGSWSSASAPTPKTTAYNPFSQGSKGKSVDPKLFNKDVWNYYHYGDPMPKKEKLHNSEPAPSKHQPREIPRTQRVMTDADVKAFHRSVNEEVQHNINKKKEENGVCAIM